MRGRLCNRIWDLYIKWIRHSRAGAWANSKVRTPVPREGVGSMQNWMNIARRTWNIIVNYFSLSFHSNEGACAKGKGTYFQKNQTSKSKYLGRWGRPCHGRVLAKAKEKILVYNLFQFSFVLLGWGRLCNRKGDLYQKNKSDLQK